MGFVAFMRSTAGRLLRGGAGLLLLYVGLVVMADRLGAALGLVGLVLVAVGVFNVCLFAPLAGLDLWGQPRNSS